MYLLHTDVQGKVRLVEDIRTMTAFGPSPDSAEHQELNEWIAEHLHSPLNLTGTFPSSSVIFLHSDPLVKYCQTFGLMLYATTGGLRTTNSSKHEGMEFCFLSLAWSSASQLSKPDSESGFTEHPSSLAVPQQVLRDLNTQVENESSPVRRVVSLSHDRTFVYLDVSDFSKFKPGREALIINSLVGVVSDKSHWTGLAEKLWSSWEAMLCIGDGYIFVFREAMAGAYFAAYLAQLIEVLGANEKLPVEFHFRIGVHVGPVYSFWDPGRGGWNYIGDGINGGNRVLAAVGKGQDDVVFISAQVRKAIIRIQALRSEAPELLACLINRGRKADKHGNQWRVYELNHTALCSPQVPEKYRKQVPPDREELQLPALTQGLGRGRLNP
jgi:class 3 adenylate cyclase